MAHETYVARFGKAIALTQVMLLLVSSHAEAQDFSGWRFYQALHFNTSTTGANVYYDVHNYPLAVALDGTNFDFSQAKADGTDVRFSGERDRAPLAHSIEHWDASGQRAIVWVKVPTVTGRSTSQSIYMHWGNAGAPDVSDSHAVFPTREGFVGVWHFDEDGNTEIDGYRDATANAAHGTGMNLRPGPRADGRLGRGLELRHAERQWVQIEGDRRKLFDLTTRLTFSIWAKAYSYSNAGDPSINSTPGYETMFAKGDNSWRLQKFGIRSWHDPPAELIEICVEQTPNINLCVIGKTDMATDQWYHFAGVHDFPLVKLYVNGVLDAVDLFDVNWKSDDHPVGFGNQSQFPERGRNWDGVLDEARVLQVAKDDYWIKLDYETQREDQRFMTFGEVQRR